MLIRRVAAGMLLLLVCGALLARWIAPFGYDEMLRDEPSAQATARHPMGTDDSGRDRLSRLLYGTQISLFLAPAAAILSTALAAAMGALAGMRGGLTDRLIRFGSDLFLCMPWMFLLIAVRALLPLNTDAGVSVGITFLLLGVLGWAGPARVIRTRVALLMKREDRLLVQAAGISPWRAFRVHLLPNLWPIAAAQFWIAVPVLILSEANLSLVGLGVPEPVPSWGNLLRGLDALEPAVRNPWLFSPLVLLVGVILLLQFVVSRSRNAVMLLCCGLALAGMGTLRAEGPEKVLRFSLRSEPRTFDPLLVDDSSSETIRYLTGGVLVRLNRATQKVAPGLASGWTVARDGKSIQFELRRGVEFSDGTPFGPEDVVYTFRRMMDPGTHSPLADAFKTKGGAVEAVAVGPHAVRISFPSSMAGLPALFDEMAIQSSRSRAKESAVLGPFLVAEHKAGVSLLLRRNPRYWERDERGRALPYLDGVQIRIQQNREAEALEFSRGELDLSERMDPDIFDRLSHSDSGHATFTDAGPSLDSEQMWFNQTAANSLPGMKKEWFADARFRRAVSAAIRRDDLCRLIYHGHAVPALGPVAVSNRFWFDSALPRRTATLEDTMRELKAAGFHKQGDTLLDRHGNRVEFSLITNAGSKVHERMLAMIQQDLARAGIRVNVVTLDFASLLERMTRTFDYEACLMSLTNVGIDPNDQMNVWLSSAENHQWNPNQKSPATAWEAEIDRLMMAQSASPDANERKKCFDRVQEIVREQEPFIYLVNPNALTGVSKRVSGVAPCLLRPQAYWNIERLSIEPDPVMLSRRQH